MFTKIKQHVKETSKLLKSVPTLMFTLFVVSVVLMTLLANKGFEITPWLALDGGIVVSWLSFLTMDVLVRLYGPAQTTKLSIIATLINLGCAAVFALVAAIPGTWGECFTDIGIDESINTALNNTISGTWFVLLGSTIAFIVASFTNNFLNYAIGKLVKKDNFFNYAIRSYGSTMVGQFVDNLIFALLVSYHFFGWTLGQCLGCAVTGAVVELLCEVLFSPVGYRLYLHYKGASNG